MNLSEAIREGAKKGKQLYGPFVCGNDGCAARIKLRGKGLGGTKPSD